MKKRLLSVLLIAALLLCLGMTGCKKKDKSGDTVISVSSVTASKGDTVKVPVKISGNPGIMALLIDFEYDATVLEYKGFEKGKIFSDYEISDNDGKLRLIVIENEDVKGNGRLIDLQFKVIGKDAKKTDVKVIIEENSICNYNEELIPAKGENGTVKIK
jgi:hypothetical protein